MRKTKRLGPPKHFRIVRPGDLSGLIRVSGMVAAPMAEEEANDEEQLPTASNLPPFEALILWTDPTDAEHKIEVEYSYHKVSYKRYRYQCVYLLGDT